MYLPHFKVSLVPWKYKAQSNILNEEDSLGAQLTTFPSLPCSQVQPCDWVSSQQKVSRNYVHHFQAWPTSILLAVWKKYNPWVLHLVLKKESPLVWLSYPTGRGPLYSFIYPSNITIGTRKKLLLHFLQNILGAGYSKYK